MLGHLFSWLENFLPLSAKERKKVMRFGRLIESRASMEKIRRYVDGISIDARDGHGRTLLHHAAKSSNDREIIEFLVNRGDTVNAKDKDGSTPFHYAAASNPHADILSALKELGADTGARDNFGERAWEKASQNSSPKVHSFLAGLWPKSQLG